MKTQSLKNVVMVAGEASGDQHGAHVIRALRKRHRDITVSGAGGQAMQTAGAQILVDARELSVMGFTAVFSKAPQILRSMSRLKRLIAESKPDLLILIDFPDFNLHLAGYAKKMGVPVLYYISPQVWAWRAGRLRKIKRRVDHMAVILPFEKSIYERHRVPVTFVGHPLMDAAPQSSESKRAARCGENPAIALLPGSREGEVNRLLPEMLKAARVMQQGHGKIRFEISRAPSIEEQMLRDYLRKHPIDNYKIVNEPVYTIFERCDLAIVASGTASLEAAIFGIPTIIVYATSAFNYWLGKRLVNVPHIGLANLIADSRVIPELVQKEATAASIAATAQNLLDDPDAYQRMQREMNAIRKRLGSSGASERVAEIACQLTGCNCAV